MASAFCFGAIAVFTIVATRDGVPLQSVLIGRYVLAAPVLAALAGAAALRLPLRRLWPLLAVGGIGQALVNGFGLSALDYVPAATASFLFYTYPAWIAGLAALRGSEKLTRRRVLALVIALTGVALMLGAPWSTRPNLTGVALALAAALAYALYVPLIRRAQGELEPAVAAAWITIAAAAVFILGGVVTRTVTFHLTPTAAGAIAGSALISTVLAFLLFLRGLKALGPVRTGILSTVEPFSTTLLAWLVLGQKITPLTLAGGALIATAVVILSREG